MDLNRAINKLAAWSFYLLFILVPLILTPYNYELFEFNKMLAVYFFTVVVACLWLAKMVYQQKVIFRRTPFDWPILIFLISQIISTFLSLNPHTSVWGYYSRFHGGLLSTICYSILLYAYINLEIPTQKSLKIISATAAIVCLYGVAQHFGIDKHLWVQDVQNRVFSTLGQPNWLAAYLIAILPFSRWWLAPLILLTIYFTKSQSGYGATGVIITLFLINYLFKSKTIKAVLFAVLAAGAVFSAHRLNLITPYSQIKQAIEKEAQTRLGGSNSMLIRRVVWKGAIDVWKHYPIFGSGVETFAYSYYNFRPVEHNLLSEWDFLYNKAHNEYLNFLATTGAFGLAAHLILVIVFLKYLIQYSYPLALSFISILITNFFGFSVVPVALLFWLLPAMAYTANPHPKNPTRKYYSLNNNQAILICLIALAGLYLLYSIINLWRADKLFNYGHNYLKLNQVPQAVKLLEQAIKISPSEPLFRNEYAESLAQLAYLYHEQINHLKLGTEAARLSHSYEQQALNQANQVLQVNSVNLNFYKSRLKILLLLSNLNPVYLEQALETIQKAIALAPTDAKLYYNLGLIYNQINQPELAKQSLQKALELKPNYIQAQEKLNSLL